MTATLIVQAAHLCLYFFETRLKAEPPARDKIEELDQVIIWLLDLNKFCFDLQRHWEDLASAVEELPDRADADSEEQVRRQLREIRDNELQEHFLIPIWPHVGSDLGDPAGELPKLSKLPGDLATDLGSASAALHSMWNVFREFRQIFDDCLGKCEARVWDLYQNQILQLQDLLSRNETNLEALPKYLARLLPILYNEQSINRAASR